MLTYLAYSFVGAYPMISFVLFGLYLSLVIFLFLKWKQFSSKSKVGLLSLVILPVIVFLLLRLLMDVPSSSEAISESDYMGGCEMERYTNGDCLFDSAKRSHANFYPLVKENDGVWKKVEGQSKDDLMRVAEKEISRMKGAEYRGREEQIARAQSFIDILSRR